MAEQPEFTAADLKAILAELGQTVQPQAKVTVLPAPTSAVASYVVLDRVRKDELPEYCTHGYASCVACGQLCWLGHATEKVVASGEAYPLCLDCAGTRLPKDAQPSERLHDHLRKDGPHE